MMVTNLTLRLAQGGDKLTPKLPHGGDYSYTKTYSKVMTNLTLNFANGGDKPYIETLSWWG